MLSVGPMVDSYSDIESIEIRLAENEDEIEASQRLRYKVFYEEYGAIPTEEMAREKRDMDEYDAITDHLIVVDKTLPKGPDRIVGTYRLLRREIADKHGRFYTSDEYDIGPLLNSDTSLLELGRSCVLPPYRTQPILKKLWGGIVHYVADHNIELMFGCASLHGTNVEEISQELAYLYHYHLAPAELCPRAVEDRYVDMNLHPKEDLNAREVLRRLPPLVKGYLRLGASIGDGAVVDKQFNTTDVCIVLPTDDLTQKYAKHYERITNKSIPTKNGAKSGTG